MQLRSILGSRFLVLSIIALVAGVSLTVLAVHAHDWFSLVSRPTVTPSGSIAQGNKALLSDDWHGSLALQPEAEKQRRRLGRRFVAPGRETATLVGVLTIGNDRQIAAITRTQDSQGEGLAIGLGGGKPSLTWDGNGGVRKTGQSVTETERSLIERIALDSPDQFILAQQRGAAYLTVARSVRPDGAGGDDNYAGPTWDLVRVTEPVASQNKPQSQWRLYYINAATGLIERVLSDEQGEIITAELAGWTNSGGELTPTRITWTRRGQVMMELSLTNAAFGPKR